MKQYFHYLKDKIYKPSIKNIFHLILAFLQIFILLWGIVAVCLKKGSLNSYEIPLSSFELQEGSILEDGSLYIDENAGVTHFLHGPYLAVDRGTYRITITYEATGTSGDLFLHDDEALYDGIQADEYYLDSNSSVFSTDFLIKEDLKNFECRIIYLGEGSLRLTSVVLRETIFGKLKSLVYTIIFVLVIQLIYYFYYLYRKDAGISKEKRYVALGLVFIWLLISYPLFTDYLFGGHDLLFHLKRIEGIKDGLLSGQLPVKIQPGWWSGAGYATGVYYPDVFLYFPAVLRILGFNVQEAFRIFLFTVNGATCLIAYGCFNKIVHNSKAALLGTLLYVTSIYRMTVLYMRQAVGELTAITFLPLVLYGFLLILNADSTAPKRKLPICLPLALGMTGVLNSHILTSELTVIFMVILCLFFLKELLQEKRWLQLVKAAGMTLLLNLWNLVPFIDYFLKRNHNISMSAIERDIQKSGTFLGQIFMSFPRFTADSSNEYASEGIGMEMPLSIGLPILILSGVALWLALDKKRRKDNDLRLATKLSTIGLMAVVFSLHIFPWNQIGALSEIINKLTFVIQFLWRYLGYAILFLCTGGVIAFSVFCRSESKDKAFLAGAAILVLSVSMSLYYSDAVISVKQADRIYTGEGVEFTGDRLYLPSGSDADKYMSTTSPTASDMVMLSDIHRNGMNMSLHVTNQSNVEEVVTIPFIYYEGYRATAQAVNERLAIVETEDQMVGVLVPGNYSGVVKVSFVEKLYWRVAELISLISAIGILLYIVCRDHNKQDDKTTMN